MNILIFRCALMLKQGLYNKKLFFFMICFASFVYHCIKILESGMQDLQVPLELVSNLISIIVVGAIFYRFFNYKKRMEVIKQLDELKQNNQLTNEDKEFIEQNYQEYGIKHQKQQALIKFVYPVLILITGCLFLLFEFTSAMIHLNVIVVSFIYLHVVRIHYKNYFNLLSQLKES